ncbi:cache domain-containing sensor histidine kinase [Cohnella laeviribosi]|uniref:cache domain-containing sensor histidine kinase n=1 Tax=Cohnella laeviribosi TaxID=380174 RepID=UPI003D207C00
MKNGGSRLKTTTIKGRFVRIVLGNLILFAVVTFSLMSWFQSVLEKKIGDSALQSVRTVAGNIDVYLKNVIRLSDSIVADSELQNLLKENQSFDATRPVWTMIETLKQLKGYSVANEFIYSIGIYSPDSRKMLTTADGIYTLPEGAQPDWLDTVRQYRDSPYIGSGLMYAVPSFSQENRASTFSVARRMRTGNRAEHVLLLNSDKSVLGKMIGDVDGIEGTGIVVTDERGGTVYAAGNPDVKAADLSRLPFREEEEAGKLRGVELNGKTFFVIRQRSDVSGWTVSLVMPKSAVFSDVTVMKHTVLALLALLSVFSLLLFALLYVQLSQPIKRLMNGMLRVEKGLPFVPIPIRRMDELGYLQQRFNQMVANEQQMRKQIYSEKLHKKEIELKFLQSQVNPHFLYNTLDSIYWVALGSGVDEIGSLVLDLSRFFRISLSRGKDFITVSETLEHLRCYLRIQQFRHMDKFEVVWDVDPSLLDVKIMKLMLQPVVENAIVHGLEAVAGTCMLQVGIKRSGEFLQCFVSDTGVGIEADKLRELWAEIREEGESGNKTYGLKNLYQRLHIVYGDDMRFSIESEAGRGTKVTIMIHLNRLERSTDAYESHHRGR